MYKEGDNMITFDIKDKIYQIFINDKELMRLMGDPIGDEQKNLKFRRQTRELTEVDADVLPFVSFVFIDATPTHNYLCNKGLLELDIYCSVDYQAGQIYRVIKPLLQKNFEDFQVTAEGESSSGISGIYCYRIRFKPFVNS